MKIVKSTFNIFLFTTLLWVGCKTQRMVDDEAVLQVSHDEATFITGEWIESNNLKRLEARDISHPHPYSDKSDMYVIYTCYKEGRPFFLEATTGGGYLENIEDYFLWTTDFGLKINLKFTIDESDTIMTYTYQHQDDKPYVMTMSPVPDPMPCDFKRYPYDDFADGITRSYNRLFFQGDYEVTDTISSDTLQVSLTSDGLISGFLDVTHYAPEEVGSFLKFNTLAIDTLDSRPIEMDDKIIPRLNYVNNHCYKVVDRPDGFDLHRVKCASKREKYWRKERATVYQFRRK